MAADVAFLADTSDPFAQLLAAEQTAQSIEACIQEKKDSMAKIKKQAVDQDVPYNDIYGYLKQLDDDVRGFKRLLQSNEASRGHWRGLHMAAWRATVRSLNVLDLPPEILTMVFAHFGDAPVVEFKPTSTFDEPPRISPDVASTKSIRLTCRAFCDAGSRFLLPVVDISFTRSSLQRLEDISTHSNFSKGVLLLRMHANPYNSLLVSDRNRFIRAASAKLSGLCQAVAHEARKSQHEVTQACRLEGVTPNIGLLRDAELFPAMAQSQRWKEILNQIITNSERQAPPSLIQDNVTKAIEHAHEEYGRRYLEQRNLMNDSKVICKIITAIRQMPRVKEICIPDAGDHRWTGYLRTGWGNRLDVHKFYAHMMDTNPFLDLMVQAGERENRFVAWETSRDFPLLYKLPVMLQAANQNLTHLDINLPPFHSHQMEAMADHLPNLQRSCRNLTAIRINVTETHWTVPTGGLRNLATTYRILDAMLVSPRLDAVSLSYLFRDIRQHRLDVSSSIGPVLAKLRWNQITQFQFIGFPIKVEELRQIMDQVSGKIDLTLRHIYLRDGSWEEALDILRGRVDSSSQVTGPRGDWMGLMSGRELQALKRQFDSEACDGWYSDDRCPGPATRYIRGGDFPNPLTRGEY